MPTNNILHSPDPLDLSAAALREAENRLREAAGQAAAVGAYDSVVIITRWAKALQMMSAEATPARSDRSSTGEPTTAPIGPRPPVTSATRPTQTEKNGKKIAPGVAVFTGDADFLIKSARSRKTREEYEHKAPAEVVHVVAACLAEWRSSKKLLTADQLLETYSKRKGGVVAYQLYVALGWMTQIGLVRRHGRSGYSIPSPNTIIEDVQQAWTKLISEPVS